MAIRYASVCSGIEAATQAFHSLGWDPAMFSEIEAFPSAVLAHHYGSNMPDEPLSKNGVPNFGDFTKITDEQIQAIGPIDILVGGTPCQSFSVAGKRLGLDDPRGNLALEYLRLACRLRAKWFLWENVPGVLSSRSDDGSSDFATFLSFVRQCGYGFAYRVLDAQYVRVDGFERAVPQRRRRVFVVGYFGDWRRAAAVLLEPEGMRGDSAPRREKGKGFTRDVATCFVSSGWGVERFVDTRGQDNVVAVVADGLVHCREVAGAITSNYGKQPDNSDTALGPNLVTLAFGGGKTLGPIDVSMTLAGDGYRIDFDTETFVAEATGILNAGGNFTGGNCQPGTTADTADSMLIAFPERLSGTQHASTENLSPALCACNPTSVAFAQNTRDEVRLFGGDGQIVGALAAEPGMKQQSYIAQQHAVRRLTPCECERLQGFPDNYTNVPWRGKNTATDGPRYKALGNSMAVNVMRWIGGRIDTIEKLSAEGRI